MANPERTEMPVKYCPQCGRSLLASRSFRNEFWVSTDTAYFCWCSHCDWQGEIVEVARIVAPELAHE
ncbi:hypothetical protein BSNK01_29670 [Bacillaceae bacterium]